MGPDAGGAMFGFVAGVGVAQAGIVGMFKLPAALTSSPMSPHRLYWLSGVAGAAFFYKLSQTINKPHAEVVVAAKKH